MELMKSLSSDRWQNADFNTVQEMARYRVPRRERISEGTYRYYVVDREGSPLIVNLEGAVGKDDPLKHIANCELKIKDKQIVAINLDGDCVISKER